MPLYEYQCQECRTAFEVRASFQEKQAGLKPVCPQCGSAEARQVLSAGLLMRLDSSTQGPTCGCGSGREGCCS